MRIEGPDFIIEPSLADCDGVYDLQILQTIKSKTNPRDEFKNVGYGMSLSRCIEKICRNRACRKIGEETTTLKQYIQELFAAKEELKKIFDEINLPTERPSSRDLR